MVFDAKLLAIALAGLASALILPVHIVLLWYFWEKYSRYVDRHFCSCSCWDTVFKGPYESGVASYKHMYFNATLNSFKIWLLTALAIIALYECIKQLITLILFQRVRYCMMLLFCLSIFSHYYAWWAYINYYNDDYYQQWYHQFFFTITELISSVIIMHLSNATNKITSRKVFCIVGVAILHITASSIDQFFVNVLRGEGYPHQIVRDIGFMVPDILQLLIPLWLLRKSRKESFTTQPFYCDSSLHKDITVMFFFVTTSLIVSMIL